MNDYARIESVIRYLEANFKEQPHLSDLAKEVGLSEAHFQRLFTRWAGVSPKAFLQCLTHTHARRLLDAGASVLDASLDSGLSGPGRLHDLCVKLEAATPGELKSGGEGWGIVVGFADSPFGRVFIGISPRGICHLSFMDDISEAEEIRELALQWHGARVERDDLEVKKLVEQVFRTNSEDGEGAPFKACVKGTAFQIRVWQALLNIPKGQLTTYKRIAEEIGNPDAVRAVGTAVGRNEIAYLIPCHRVIRESGALGGYRWGMLRKRALVARESSLFVAKQFV